MKFRKKECKQDNFDPDRLAKEFLFTHVGLILLLLIILAVISWLFPQLST